MRDITRAFRALSCPIALGLVEHAPKDAIVLDPERALDLQLALDLADHGRLLERRRAA